MNRPIAGIAAVRYFTASADAHSARECRTALAAFDAERAAFEESMEIAGPILERLSAAWEEADGSGSHAGRHAVLYRHFVGDFPEMRPRLSDAAAAASKAMDAAGRAIFCLSREREPPR